MIQTNQNPHDMILCSPLPGKVVKVLAHEGEFVKQGQRIFIVESMKMLHVLRASKAGKMKNISVKEGDIIGSHNHLAYLQ